MSERYVYFIRPVGMTTPVKVGCSQSPADRLESLYHWSPFPLEVVVTIPGGLDLERNIHQCFDDLHSHHEWFNDDGRIGAVIDKLLAGVPIEQAMDLTKRVSTLSKKALSWKNNPEGRLRFSYAIRISAAARRAGKALGVYVGEPSEVSDIMVRWRGIGRLDGGHYRGDPITPTADEFALLGAYVDDPLAFYRAAEAA